MKEEKITRTKDKASYLVGETRKLAETEALNRRLDAVEPVHNVIDDNGWTVTKATWAEASEAKRRDIIYGMAFHDGAKPKDIAKFFSIKEADLKPYAEQFVMGQTALKLKIQRDQIRSGLANHMPVAKFHLGKQFAEQVDHPAHDGVNSLDDGKEQAITINVIGKDSATTTTTNGTDSFSEVHQYQ